MKPLSNSELATFCNQLSLILRSGISTLEGLSIMLEDTPEGEGKKILETVLHEMEVTGSLYLSLDAAQVFPAYLRSMVEIGEQSGRLDDVMTSLAAHYQREESLSKNIKNAVTYPLIMLGMMVAVMLVLIIKVLPVFDQVFQQLGASLTGVSRTVLDIGNALSRYSVAFVLFALFVAAVFLLLFYTKKGRDFLPKLSGKFFFTKRMSEKLAYSRFASGMYLSLCSGLDVDHSLEMASRLVAHPVVSGKIQRMQGLIAEGTSFCDAISEVQMFSGIYSRMIVIGFKTGTMDDVMKQVSSQYDEEIQEQLSSLVAKVEPTLVALLSVAVGMILLSVMLPLMGIMSNIG